MYLTVVDHLSRDALAVSFARPCLDMDMGVSMGMDMDLDTVHLDL